MPAWLRGSKMGTWPEQLLAELGLGDTSLPPAHGTQLGWVTPGMAEVEQRDLDPPGEPGESCRTVKLMVQSCCCC